MVTPTSPEAELVQLIRTDLAARADPQRAASEQAYMKSEMPFLGVPVPEVRRIVRAAAKQAAAGESQRAARAMWDEASHREHWYAALALLALTPNRGDPALVPLIEHMVRTAGWWDITDEAAHRVADLLEAHPEETAALVRGWSTDADMWMRRLAIIAQLGRRDRLDRALLQDAIAPNLTDPEFFIRKAIGWALREHARIDPAWVQDYCDNHAVSPLTRREALKHVSGP